MNREVKILSLLKDDSHEFIKFRILRDGSEFTLRLDSFVKRYGYFGLQKFLKKRNRLRAKGIEL